jgi:hypothetical protein
MTTLSEVVIENDRLRSEVAELRSIIDTILAAYEHSDPDTSFAKAVKAIGLK